jgi:hypothetical protein
LLAGLPAAGQAAGLPYRQDDCNDPQPTIETVQPSSVFNGTSVNLVITGAGFGAGPGAVVIVENVGALDTTFVTGSVLNAALPAGVPPGTYDVRVVDANGNCAQKSDALTVTGPTGTPEPSETPEPTNTPVPTNTPGPTAFIRPVIVVESYGASAPLIVPGENLDFEITLRNDGQIPAVNIVTSFTPGDFTPRVTGGVHNTAALGPGERTRFFQPLTAAEGLADQATLEVTVNYNDQNGTAYEETFTLTFNVRAASGATISPTPTLTGTPSLRPQLLIESYSVDLATLRPGARFNLTLRVRNVGNADARRVTMILGGGSAGGPAGGQDGTPQAPGGDGGGVSGAGGEFSDFAPIDSSNVQFLGDLESGATLTASQTLIVNGGADPGAYAIKYSFAYSDSAGTAFTDDQVVTLLVYAVPQVEISFYREAGPFFVGEPNVLPLQIVNLGRGTVVLGNMRVTAPGAELSNAAIAVGSLDSGGFFTLDTNIVPSEPGPLEVQVRVDYTDDFNQAQAITETLSVEVMEPLGPPPGSEGPGPVEPVPSAEETFGQVALRAFLGLIGLDSGRPQAEALPPPDVEIVP